MLPYALEAGVAFFDFWEMTYGEITLVVKGWQEKEKRKQQEQAYHNYILADLVGASVARLMDKKAKFPKIHEVYPHLYDAPKEKQAWEISKERMMKYALMQNKKGG